MVVMMVLMSERVEKHPRATLAAFPPPIFTGTASVSIFHISPPPRFAIIKGVFIWAFLGQAERLETKMDDSGGSRHKRVWVVRPVLWIYDTSQTYL
jgi:hypothetical protein